MRVLAAITICAFLGSVGNGLADEEQADPTYHVRPPDGLRIEMVRMAPRLPYRIDDYDVLQIAVLDTPIDGFYLVESKGGVNLGAAYGTVFVGGMTIDEARGAIIHTLEELISSPNVSLQMVCVAEMKTKPVSRFCVVETDGTIDLADYGVLKVADKTALDVKQALKEHLSEFFDAPDPSVRIVKASSMVFYVITEGASLGNNSRTLLFTGKETVLDALSHVEGLSQTSDVELCVVMRPTAVASDDWQYLPVDYAGIAKGGLATNYQLQPGDRVYVSNGRFAGSGRTRFDAIRQRLKDLSFGFCSLGIRGYQTIKRDYDKQKTPDDRAKE